MSESSGYVIVICGLVTGEATSVDGMFCQGFDPSGHDGRGDLTATRLRARAKKFPTVAEAFEYWRQVSKTHPYRYDGKPNRPFTAYSVNIVAYAQADTVAHAADGTILPNPLLQELDLLKVEAVPPIVCSVCGQQLPCSCKPS